MKNGMGMKPTTIGKYIVGIRSTETVGDLEMKQLVAFKGVSLCGCRNSISHKQKVCQDGMALDVQS